MKLKKNLNLISKEYNTDKENCIKVYIGDKGIFKLMNNVKN
jgi:hypothetical protein